MNNKSVVTGLFSVLDISNLQTPMHKLALVRAKKLISIVEVFIIQIEKQ